MPYLPRWAGALALVLLPSLASGQQSTSSLAQSGTVPPSVPCVLQPSGACLPVSPSNPMPVTPPPAPVDPATGTGQAANTAASTETSRRLGDPNAPAAGTVNAQLATAVTQLTAAVTQLTAAGVKQGAILAQLQQTLSVSGTVGVSNFPASFGSTRAVVTGDQAYTLGSFQTCTMTATGRLKVGLSSAAQEGATVAGYSDLIGALGPDGFQHALRLDGSNRLTVADPLLLSAVAGLYQSGGALPLPTGAASEAKLEAVRALLAGTLSVGLPAGAASDAKLEAIRALLAGTITVGGTVAVSNNSDYATGTKQTANTSAIGTMSDRLHADLIAPTQPGTAVAGTDASGTITTANTYQPLQAANATRKGCLIVNIASGVTEQVKVGSTVYPLLPGQPFSCASGLIIAGDAISITSATAGSAFSALFQ